MPGARRSGPRPSASRGGRGEGRPSAKARTAEPSDRPRAFIVGAGRVGGSLAMALPDVGVDVLGAWTRRPGSAARVRRKLGLRCSSGRLPDALSHADMVFLTVPDDAVEPVCRDLAREGLIGRGQDVIHCSGCLGLSVLGAAEEAGASVGSLHPLAAFMDPRSAGRVFHGSLALVEGGSPAVTRRLRALASGLGMKPARLSGPREEAGERRALYHAAAVTAAAGVLSTMDLALEAGRAAGLSRREALEGLVALARGTLDNLERSKVTSKALTGPVARGDERVVRRHLAVLGRLSKGARRLYRELSRRAEEIARTRPEAS